MQGWMQIPVCGWDMSLCAVSRWNIFTGARWQRHGVINIGGLPGDGSQYPYVYHGAQTTPGTGMSAAWTPQQATFLNAGTPGYALTRWDWRNSWMWAVKQVGYQVAYFGKVWNTWPSGQADSYCLNVGGTNLFDRYMLFLDDDILDNQTDATNNAYQTGQPYSGVDHTLHNESLYYATAAGPFVFNNNMNSGGGSTLLSAPGANGDTWNTSAFLGTAGSTTRTTQNTQASAFLPDYYNRLIIRFLQATAGAPDNGGKYPQPPFVLFVAPRGSHNQWNIGQRHWSVTPTNIPGRVLGNTQNATSAITGTKPSWTSTLAWSNEPSLSNLSTANGAYVMVGCEAMLVQSGYVGDGGAHTWTLQRDVLNDEENAMPQITSPPVWPAGTPVIQISSSLDPDGGLDDASFNEPSLTDKSPWWRGVYQPTGSRMTALQCVQCRHDRIIKAKTGMAHDELFYDIKNYCDTHFSNPTVSIIISDNGWTYGEHCCPKGKWKPYDRAGVGPVWAYWPDSSSATQYPYFSQRPNIIIYLADDEDSESLVAGYPILQSAVSGCRQESSCVAWNGDIAATICDLAGAPPFAPMDGQSLAPYMSGGLTGGTPRTYGTFSSQSDATGGQPTFLGIYSANRRYWHWGNYTVSPNYVPYTQSTGPGVSTKAQAPAATYTGIIEGYNHDVDPDEINNWVANTVTPYTPTAPNAFTAAEQAQLEAFYQASQASAPRPAWCTDTVP